jgi:hypothetical protein
MIGVAWDRSAICLEMRSASITLTYKGHILGQKAGKLVVLLHHVGDTQESENKSNNSNGIVSVHTLAMTILLRSLERKTDGFLTKYAGANVFEKVEEEAILTKL